MLAARLNFLVVLGKLDVEDDETYDNLADAYGMLWEVNNRQPTQINNIALSSAQRFTDVAVWNNFDYAAPTLTN